MVVKYSGDMHFKAYLLRFGTNNAFNAILNSPCFELVSH